MVDEDRLVVSIMVVSYNQRRYIDDCLAAVLDQSFPCDAYEVLFLDNHSDDGSVDYVKQRYPKINLVVFDENLGYYGALSRAMSKARGKYVIILPLDTIVHRDFASEFVRAADMNDRIVVCMANTINPDAPDYAAKERIKMPRYMYVPETTLFGNPHVKQRPFDVRPTRLLLSSGVSFLIRKDFHTQVKGVFDLSFPHYTTDIDVSLRANVLGHQVVFVPTAVVYHIDDSKSKVSIDLLRRYFIGSRDRLLAFYKSMNTLEYVLALPFLLVGIPHKVLVMRSTVPPLIRFTLLGMAIFFSPLALIAALLKPPHFYEKRKAVLSARQVGYFWVLKNLVRTCIGVVPCRESFA